MKVKFRRWFFMMGIVVSFTAGCVEKMAVKGRLRPLYKSAPAGTVPFQSAGEMAEPKMTTVNLRRGRELYGVYCLPCHGVSGEGDGEIVKRGFLPPPTYHSDRLRQAPDIHFFDVMTRGYGAMYSYADRLSSDERWAIVHYIRALQFSQNARVADLPPEDRGKIR